MHVEDPRAGPRLGPSAIVASPSWGARAPARSSMQGVGKGYERRVNPTTPTARRRMGDAAQRAGARRAGAASHQYGFCTSFFFFLPILPGSPHAEFVFTFFVFLDFALKDLGIHVWPRMFVVAQVCAHLVCVLNDTFCVRLHPRAHVKF